MHFVPIKTDNQLDLQALHRVPASLNVRDGNLWRSVESIPVLCFVSTTQTRDVQPDCKQEPFPPRQRPRIHKRRDYTRLLLRIIRYGGDAGKRSVEIN